MVNSSEFAKRIDLILKYYGLSAAGFADKINVGRSSISHILSGRNKPSLDFVMKICQTFPEVELYWLLNGKGNFPKNSSSTPTEKSTSKAVENKNEVPAASEKIIEKNNFDKKIDKIVIFYTDGSFDAFQK